MPRLIGVQQEMIIWDQGPLKDHTPLFAKGFEKLRDVVIERVIVRIVGKTRDAEAQLLDRMTVLLPNKPPVQAFLLTHPGLPLFVNTRGVPPAVLHVEGRPEDAIVRVFYLGRARAEDAPADKVDEL